MGTVTTRSGILCIALAGMLAAPAVAAATEEPAADWGKEQNGLRTRLSLVSASKVGEPVVVKLELQNAAKEVRSYDSQQAAVNGSFQVTGPDGKPVPYVDLSYQTAGQSKRLKPGDTVTILDKHDVAKQYLLDKPGKYVVRFGDRHGLPGSNEVSFTLAEGTLPDLLQALIQLRGAAPAGWRAAKFENGIFLSLSPTSLKRDVLSVEVWFTKEKKSGYEDQKAARPNLEYVMETRLGHAWLCADDKVKTAWPAYAAAVRDALRPLAAAPAK